MIDKSRLNDIAYVKDLPKCKIEYEQGSVRGYSAEMVLKVNELLEDDDFKEIVYYIFDMGYEDGLEEGRDESSDQIQDLKEALREVEACASTLMGLATAHSD